MDSKVAVRKHSSIVISSYALLFVSVYFLAFHLISLEQVHDEIKGLLLFVDLSLILPAIYFLFVARKGYASKLLTIPLFGLGMLSTINFAPDNTIVSEFTSYYLVVAVLIGSAAISYLMLRLAISFKRFSHLKGEPKIEAMSIFITRKTKFSKILQTELLTFYYALFSWFKSNKKDEANTFSYHRKSGHYGMVIGVTVFHIPGIAFVHVVVANMAPQLLLIFTLLHLYSFYFCVAFARALIHRPVLIADAHLQIRCGLLFNNAIPLENIESAKVVGFVEAEKRIKTRLKATLFGHCNVLIKLKKTRDLDILGGITKPCDQVLLGVDEPGKLVSAIAQYCCEKS